MKIKKILLLFTIIMITVLLNQTLLAQEKVKIKDTQGNSLIEINDEGTFGSILIPDSVAAPGITTNKLYNVNGTLNFNGNEVGSKLSTFQLTTNPSDGFVLTSDANGNASWQSLLGGTSNLSIGDTHGGGIIFWLDGSGQHGLIAAPQDESTNYAWYLITNAQPTLPLGSARGIFAGEANTKLLHEFGGGYARAATVCYNKTTNGYNDWYLPSLDETIIMMTNLHLQGLGNFNAASHYWTSNQPETIGSYQEAYSIYLQNSNSTPTVRFAKSTSVQNYKVRAIRKF